MEATVLTIFLPEEQADTYGHKEIPSPGLFRPPSAGPVLAELSSCS
jgi:hypothetical protein